MQHQTLCIVRLQCSRVDVAKIKFVVDTVLDNGHVVARHQFNKLALFLIRHLETERVLEVRHDHARGNLLILQNICEDREINPLL